MGNKLYNTGRYIGMIWGIVMVCIGFSGIFVLGVIVDKPAFITIIQNLEIVIVSCAMILLGAWLFVDSKSG